MRVLKSVLSCNLMHQMKITMMYIQHLEHKSDLEWIETQLQSFKESVQKADYYSDSYDDFYMPVQQPIVKAAKVYPNEPCPCGSGKKYKKCCGKK